MPSKNTVYNIVVYTILPSEARLQFLTFIPIGKTARNISLLEVS